jgi:hypothetical protein
MAYGRGEPEAMMLRDLLVFALVPIYFLALRLLIEARRRQLFIIRRTLQRLILLTIRLFGLRAAKRIWGWRVLWAGREEP